MRHRALAAFPGIIFFLSILFISLPAESVQLDKLKLGGYIDLEYTNASNDQSPLPSGDLYDNGSFHQRHFNLLMEAAVSERLIVKGHIEFEDGVDTTANNHGGILVEWAFAEFLLTDYLKFRGGKIRTPYGFFNEVRDSTPALVFVEVPHSIYEPTVVGGNNNLMPKWYTGLNAFGDIFLNEDILVDYTMYISNGEGASGVNEDKFDQNKDKAVGGRIQLNSSFSDMLSSTIGFSFFSGDRAFASGTGGFYSREHTSYGVSGLVDFENFNFTGEYFISRLAGLEEKAYFLNASYAIKHRFTPYVAYSYLDPDNEDSSLDVDDYWKSIWLGINLKVVDGLFFKFEHRWNIRGDNNGHSGTPNKNNDYREIRAAFVVAF